MESTYLWVAGLLLCRLGLSAYSTGLVRSKNAASTAGRHLLDVAVGVLAFWMVGGAILHQHHNSWLGLNVHWLAGAPSGGSPLTPALGALFGAVLIGAIAERSRLWPTLILSAVLAGFILPIVQRWAIPMSLPYTPDGWLAHLHSLSNGLALSNIAAAAVALAAVRAVGPRDGKYHRDGSASLFPAHNPALAMLGALLAVAGMALLMGNPVLILLAASAGALTSALYGQFSFGKVDLSVVTMAMIGAAVAQFCAGDAMAQWAGVFIGLIAGLIVPIALVKVDLVLRLDDVAGTITLHGICGLWGMLAAGLFTHAHTLANPGWAGRFNLILVQLLAAIVVALFSYGVAWLTLGLIRMGMKLRVSDADEFDGLDLAEHDVGAYPDFQQNSIKSYHLREA